MEWWILSEGSMISFSWLQSFVLFSSLFIHKIQTYLSRDKIARTKLSPFGHSGQMGSK